MEILKFKKFNKGSLVNNQAIEYQTRALSSMNIVNQSIVSDNINIFNSMIFENSNYCYKIVFIIKMKRSIAFFYKFIITQLKFL